MGSRRSLSSTSTSNYHAKWYLANRERERAKNKDWYATHREEHKARCAARYARKRPEALATHRAYSRTAAGMLSGIRSKAKRRLS